MEEVISHNTLNIKFDTKGRKHSSLTAVYCFDNGCEKAITDWKVVRYWFYTGKLYSKEEVISRNALNIKFDTKGRKHSSLTAVYCFDNGCEKAITDWKVVRYWFYTGKLYSKEEVISRNALNIKFDTKGRKHSSLSQLSIVSTTAVRKQSLIGKNNAWIDALTAA